jgi:hypothetical protein
MNAQESTVETFGDLDTCEAFFRFGRYFIEMTPQVHARTLEALEHVEARNLELLYPCSHSYTQSLCILRRKPVEVIEKLANLYLAHV